MPQRISGKYAGDVGKPRPTWIHGKLMPVEAEFRKWADNQLDANGKPIKDQFGKNLKVDGTGGVVSYAEWVRLPEGKRGQKWFISIDQRIFHPDWEKLTTRSFMVDFPEWQKFVLPGLLDTLAGAKDPIQEFLDRADAETWYVEAELVFSGMYDEKPQNLPKLSRMTQDLEELKKWHAERYPGGEKLEVPEDILNQAKFVWTRFAKGDKDKFSTAVNEDTDLSPYLMQFAANDYALVKG